MRQLTSNKDNETVKTDQTTRNNCFLKASYCSSVRTDLPLTVIGRKKKNVVETISTGQLFCVGEVYLKTHNGIVRIR